MYALAAEPTSARRWPQGRPPWALAVSRPQGKHLISYVCPSRQSLRSDFTANDNKSTCDLRPHIEKLYVQTAVPPYLRGTCSKTLSGLLKPWTVPNPDTPLSSLHAYFFFLFFFFYIPSVLPYHLI